MDYKVFIADDEPEIAEGLQFLIQRFCHDCHVVGLANDGLEGWQKAVVLQPDIVLTDIRMPECDGLEMIRKIQEAGVLAKYIILSGYAEFEYAKTAISLGVEEFITKPIEEEVLLQALQRVCMSIKKERDKQEKVQYIRNTAKEYMLKNLLDQKDMNLEVFKEQLQHLGFPVYSKGYLCLAIDMAVQPDEHNRKLMVHKITERELSSLNFLKYSLLIEYSSRFVVLVGILNQQLEHQVIISAVEKLRNQLAWLLYVPISIGIGTVCHDVDGLPGSFEKACCALNYKIIKGNDSVISYHQICDITDKPSLVSAEDIRRLETGIERLDDVACKEVIEDIFRKISQEKELNLETLQRISLNLILSGIRKIPYVQMELNNYLGKNIFTLESISKFQTIEQLKNWIVNTLKSMNELMLKDNLREKKDVVQEAKEYIARNFNKEIGLNEISERFFINPSYFSQLFKKKTGETYQNYLIGLRIDRAKKLLAETDLTIQEVCAMVGYTNINHFNRIFERVMGVKPGEYRKRVKM